MRPVYLIVFSILIISLTFACEKSKWKIGQSCTLIRNSDNTYKLAVNREHVNDTIFNIQKIGVRKENENSDFTWIYVYGTYTPNKRSLQAITKTGWVHVSDGGNVKVVLHGVYHDSLGSFHGRKDAAIYSIEEGRKKLCK